MVTDLLNLIDFIFTVFYPPITVLTLWLYAIPSLDASSLIDFGTKAANIYVLVMWFHITLFYVGDILNYCSATLERVERIGLFERSKRVLSMLAC
mmetsp:Transcript_650/g.1364  ORF Transcript_650/g.1364 Transcript_650/m.1364 type:complete len:95 (-) Transcript_650:557-841(-)